MRTKKRPVTAYLNNPMLLFVAFEIALLLSSFSLSGDVPAPPCAFDNIDYAVDLPSLPSTPILGPDSLPDIDEFLHQDLYDSPIGHNENVIDLTGDSDSEEFKDPMRPTSPFTDPFDNDPPAYPPPVESTDDHKPFEGSQTGQRAEHNLPTAMGLFQDRKPFKNVPSEVGMLGPQGSLVLAEPVRAPVPTCPRTSAPMTNNFHIQPERRPHQFVFADPAQAARHKALLAEDDLSKSTSRDSKPETSSQGARKSDSKISQQVARESRSKKLHKAQDHPDKSNGLDSKPDTSSQLAQKLRSKNLHKAQDRLDESTCPAPKPGISLQGGHKLASKRPYKAVYDTPFADPSQVGSNRRKGKKPMYREPSEDPPSEDSNETVTIWVSRKFYWFEEKPLTLAQAARPESRRPPPKSSWRARPSLLDDMGPNRSFELDLEDASQAYFIRQALALLEVQLPGAKAYMDNQNPRFTVTLYGTIMLMTRATARLPARRRIKEKFRIDNNTAWIAFLSELAVLDKVKSWAGAHWEMTDPSLADVIPAAAHLEATNLARWQAKALAPGPAPAPVIPQVTDDRAYSKLALALRRRYTQNGLGSGDNMVVGHPTKPNWQMSLTPKRIHLWVQRQLAASLEGRNEIDLDHPPQGPEFRWSLHGIEQTEGDENPTGRACAEPLMPAEPPTASTSARAIPPEPPQADRRQFVPRYCGSMEDFLAYALVLPEDQRTRDALANSGFTNWAALQPGSGVTTDMLIGYGILPGTAAALIRFAADFVGHVIQCIAHGSFFPPEQ